jgi:hypothetical protein
LAKSGYKRLSIWLLIDSRIGRALFRPTSGPIRHSRPDLLFDSAWIHFGSQEAGPRIAAILYIVETCRRLQIPIRNYLASILPGLADLPVRRVAALTPTAWVARP